VTSDSRSEIIIRTLLLTKINTYTVGTFGDVVLLPLFGLRRKAGLAFRFLPFLVEVYSQLLFAHNEERLLVIAFLALILQAYGLRITIQSQK